MSGTGTGSSSGTGIYSDVDTKTNGSSSTGTHTRLGASANSGGDADLIVYAKFFNKLQTPHLPAKQVHIGTLTENYFATEFLTPLYDERPVNLAVENELGMPMELGAAPKGTNPDGAYWLGDRSRVAPSTEVSLAHMGDDRELLGPAAASDLPLDLPDGLDDMDEDGVKSGTGSRKLDVTWLRRTEYLSNSEREFKPSLAGQVLTSSGDKSSSIDLEAKKDPKERIKVIEESFEAAKTIPVHPKKPKAKVVNSFPIVPNMQLAPVRFGFTRFNEDPVESLRDSNNASIVNKRITHAIYRPVEMPNGTVRVSVYIPSDDAIRAQYNEERTSQTISDTDYDFRALRDYEVLSSKEIAVGSELAVTLSPEGQLQYTMVTDSNVLRKYRSSNRTNDTEFPPELVEQGIEYWDGLSVKLTQPSAAEEVMEVEVDEPAAEDVADE